ERAVCAGVAVLMLALAGCSDGPVQPAMREQVKRSLHRQVPQANGQSCTEPDAKLSSGALFKICFDPAKWNRDLVVFIPGYHDPASAPTLPQDLSPTAASLLFGGLGYGYATTSFHATGLIEPDTWIGGGLLELVETAKALLSATTGRTTRYVYQTGGSQGGLGTVMAVERYPNIFSGGLAGCGPIGDYRKQIDYVADFRVVFDHFFTGTTPAWSVWRQDLSAGDPGDIDPGSWDAAEASAGAARRVADVGAAAAAPRHDPRHGRPDRPDLARGAVSQAAGSAQSPAEYRAYHQPVRALQLHRRGGAGGVRGARPRGERPEPAGIEERPAAAGGPGGVSRPGPASRSVADGDSLVGGREHPRRPAVLQNAHRVLEVGGERAVFGDHRPLVVEGADVGAAQVHHRLDGDG